MKQRNPLFVAGFPLAMISGGYAALEILMALSSNSEDIPEDMLLPVAVTLIVVLIGAGYTVYWLIHTAHALRRLTDKKIPPAILLVIPFANLWWLWRYSVAAEAYTKGKVQGALGFVLLVLLEPIGPGILQDYYNKVTHDAAQPADHRVGPILP